MQNYFNTNFNIFFMLYLFIAFLILAIIGLFMYISIMKAENEALFKENCRLIDQNSKLLTERF